MLTLEELKELEPGAIIDTGIVENNPEGVYMTDSRLNDKLMWIAKRGGIHDWGIYIHWAESGFTHVLNNGDKVTSKEHIQKLVPCTEEALNMYRY